MKSLLILSCLMLGAQVANASLNVQTKKSAQKRAIASSVDIQCEIQTASGSDLTSEIVATSSYAKETYVRFLKQLPYLKDEVMVTVHLETEDYRNTLGEGGQLLRMTVTQATNKGESKPVASSEIKVTAIPGHNQMSLADLVLLQKELSYDVIGLGFITVTCDQNI